MYDYFDEEESYEQWCADDEITEFIDHFNLRYTPDFITKLKKKEIYVFGSNENGTPFDESTRLAYEQFDAQPGIANGQSGRTYAISMFDRNMEKIEPEPLYIHIKDFIQHVRQHPDHTFYLTKIGCTSTGWSTEEVKKILWDVLEWAIPLNLIIPKEFMRTARDFTYQKGTIYRKREKSARRGEVSVKKAPYIIEYLNNRNNRKWYMDFNSTLIIYNEHWTSEATLDKGYCWVITK